MHNADNQTPFAELPAALVEEVLTQTSNLAGELVYSLANIRNQRLELRRQLLNSHLILVDSSLGYPPQPTTCAADGSYAIERLLTVDLAAAAAVAVEGLVPPSEKRHWELPHHKTFVMVEPHVEETATILRALMLGAELQLATAAPHDLVMFDGTLTLPIIYFNQALNKAPEVMQLSCATEFVRQCIPSMKAFLAFLKAQRSDKQYISLPKYSTRKEIGKQMEWPTHYDDRAMLTLLLEPGEFTKPQELEQPRDQEGNPTWHLNVSRLPGDIRAHAEPLTQEIITAISQIHVVYYKPQPWLPCLRIEMAKTVATNSHRLATVLQGLKHQCATASMLEPYPLYFADRTAKALARAMPAFRQVATQRVSEHYAGDISEVFFAMHGYRSEMGR